MAKLGKIKFCFNFKPNHPDIDVIDEINITLAGQTTEELKKFLNKHKEQRINIIIPNISYLDEGIISDLTECLEENHYLRLNWQPEYSPIDEAIRNALQKHNIKYYYYVFVDNWDKFNEIANLNVSDIYIINSLGFEMKYLHDRAVEYNINIRVFPNIAQSAWQGAPAVTKFFIRPEDCYRYSQYVDTFEFYENESPLTNSEMLYQVYAEKEKFYGDLKTIILGLDETIDNRLLNSHWVDSRINCGKRCAKENSCKICNRYFEMSNLMTEKEKQFDYLINPEKN